MHEEETTIIVASAKDTDKEVSDSRKKLVKEIQGRVLTQSLTSK